MKSKIFISYSRKDYDVVVRLRDEIHRRTGSLPWMDLSGIETGAQFADVIAGAIDECGLLVFVISQHSVVSEWTRREVLYALEKHKKIYPVVIDEAQMPKDLRFLLSNLNCIDIRDAVQRENLFSDLATDVSQKDSPISSLSHGRGPVETMINGIKALRFKMMMVAISQSRVVKSAIAFSAIAIVAVAILAVVLSRRAQRELTGQSEKFKSLEQFKTSQQEKFALKLLNHLDEEAKGSVYPVQSLDALGIPREISASDFDVFPTVTVAERERRDSFWEACAIGKSPYRAKLRAARAKNKVEQVIQNLDITKIRTMNPAKADELRFHYNKVVELAAKLDTLQEKFDELHKKAKIKIGNGLDDIEELIQACKIAKEMYALSETTEDAAGKLGYMWNRYKEELSEGRKNDHTDDLKKISNARIERDSFWNSHSRAFNAYTDGVSDNARLEKKKARDIAEIRVINNANADQLQLFLDKFLNLAAKEESFDREIDALREKANEKQKSGLDDKDEYLQATKLNEDRGELHKELQNVVANLNTAETNMLERINRDWFWDLHNSGTCSLNSEPIRNCMKRSIAVKEAGDNRVEYVKALQKHFEEFVRDEEFLALAQQEFARRMKLADEKRQNGLDDSAELLSMRGFFKNNFYREHLINKMHPSWLLKTSFSDRVKFDYSFYDARNFSLRLQSYLDLFRREITLITEEDKTLGEKFQQDFEKLCELLAKETSYQRSIDVLCEKAREKNGKDLDDIEEFLQAQKIAKEVTTFHKKELQPLADTLFDRMRDYKRKKSRWDDLYRCRDYSLDVELARQGIAEVSRFSEEIATMLQTELDGLVAGNAKMVPLQREIDLLRKKAKEKLRKGQDDSEEYRKAKEIYEKEWKFYNHELNYQVELDCLNSLVADVRRRSVTLDRWADKSSNGLWRIEKRKSKK